MPMDLQNSDRRAGMICCKPALTSPAASADDGSVKTTLLSAVLVDCFKLLLALVLVLLPRLHILSV